MSATKDKEGTDTPYRDNPNEKSYADLGSVKGEEILPARQSWLDWAFGPCNVL